MGILFALALQFVFIGVASAVVAIIAANLIPKQTSANIWSARILPFVGLYTLCGFGLLGLIEVSVDKNIDMGIGDEWHVPLPNHCKLRFVDVPQYGLLLKNDNEIIDGVTELEMDGGKVLGKGYKKYFSYNLDSDKLYTFRTIDSLIAFNGGSLPKLLSGNDFYDKRRNELAGFELSMVGLVSLSFSLLAMFIVRKIIVRVYK